MGRTEKILGRIRRNLKSLSSQDLLAEEIYDEMQSAQITIINETYCLEKEITIETEADLDEYDLESNVLYLKNIILPAAYVYDIVVKSNAEWNGIVNTDMSSTQPLYATIFNNKLLFYPAPADSAIELKLWVVLSEPDTVIAAGTEPEVKSCWDDAIEYFATAKLSGNQDKWMALFQIELEKKSHLSHIKHTTGKQLPSRF